MDMIWHNNKLVNFDLRKMLADFIKCVFCSLPQYIWL